MRLLALRSILLASVAAAVGGPAFGAVFNVSNEMQFQSALDTAAVNGEDDTVVLAAGTYSVTSNGSLPFRYVVAPACNSGAVADSLTITGAGAGSTILDGGGVHQVLHLRHERFGPVCLDQPVSGTEVDNNNDDSQAAITVEDLTIRNGQIAAIPAQRDTSSSSCSFADVSEQAGGLAVTVSRSEVVVRNNEFSANTGNEGGGMKLSRACGSNNVDVINNLFAGNGTEPFDGVDFFFDPATCQIFDTDTGGLSSTSVGGSSRAQAGGGAKISARDGRVTLTDNIFSGNMANADPGAGGSIFGVDGGGLSGKGIFGLGEPGSFGVPSCPNSTSPWAVDVTYDPAWGTNPDNPATIPVGGSVWDIERNVFENNVVNGGDGGGAHLWGNMHLTDNRFIGNESRIVAGFEFSDAYDGGGLHIFTKSAFETSILTRNLFQNNSAPGEGGGLQLRSPRDRVDVTASIFAGNDANGHVGSSSERHVSQGGGGGAYLYTDDGTLNFVNNSVCNNTADAGFIADRPRAVGNGGGVVIYAQLSDDSAGTTSGGPFDLPAVANIYNNVIWANTADPDTGSGNDLFIEDLHAGSNRNYNFGMDPITDSEGSEINLFSNNFADIAHLCEDDPNCTSDLSAGSNTSLDPQFSSLDECRLASNSPLNAVVGTPNAPGMPDQDFDGNAIDSNSPILGAVGMVETVPGLSCEGFQFPLDRAVTVRRFRQNPPFFDSPNPLPFKMRLFDEVGVAITNQDIFSPPVIDVVFDGYEEDVVPEELPFIGAGDDGNRFIFVNNKWQFWLSTREFGATGTYYVTVSTGDEAEYVVDPTCTGTFTITNPFSWFSWW